MAEIPLKTAPGEQPQATAQVVETVRDMLARLRSGGEQTALDYATDALMARVGSASDVVHLAESLHASSHGDSDGRTNRSTHLAHDRRHSTYYILRDPCVVIDVRQELLPFRIRMP